MLYNIEKKNSNAQSKEYQRGKLNALQRTASFSKESAVKYAFTARGRGTFLIVPRPQTFCFQKAQIKGFLLMYRLFLYYLWFFQNIGKGWRKNIFNFLHFQKSRKYFLFQKIFSSLFQYYERTITSTETNDTSAESS